MVTATVHRWLTGLSSALVVVSAGWSTIDTTPLGIPEGVGPAIAAISALFVLAVNAFRAATDPQHG